MKLMLFMISASVAMLAQNGRMEVRATIPKSVDEEDVQVSIVLDGGTIETPCPMSGSSIDGYTKFSCDATVGEHSALFRFKMPGYKVYSVNVANVRLDRSETLELNLGAVQATDAEVPRIENITLTSATDGTERFQITVHNLSKKQVLVTGISMAGSGFSGCGVGTGPPLYYKFSDSLLLTTSKLGKTTITATLADLGDHPEMPATVRGTGIFDDCGDSEFELSASANFTLPADDYTEIELIVPRTGHSVIGKANLAKKSSSKKRIQVPTADILLGTFDTFKFSLATSDKDCPEIKSHWSPFRN